MQTTCTSDYTKANFVSSLYNGVFVNVFWTYDNFHRVFLFLTLVDLWEQVNISPKILLCYPCKTLAKPKIEHGVPFWNWWYYDDVKLWGGSRDVRNRDWVTFSLLAGCRNSKQMLWNTFFYSSLH